MKDLGKYIVLLFLLLQCFTRVKGQENLEKYPFLSPDSSRIINAAALEGFFGRCYQLKTTGQGRANVLHIGDSHVQADFFSGMIRMGLQKKFGNAGRGLIFPYRLARSNEPSDYRSSSTVAWEYKRNVFPELSLPIGIGGYTIQSTDSNADITVSLKINDTLDYRVTRLTLFHDRADDQFDFAVYDSSMNEIGYIMTHNFSENNFTSTFRFPMPVSKFIIKPCPRTSSQVCARVFGLLLENDRHGLLYNMIGVNGAEFRHYNASRYFFDQMRFLRPNLVVVSLGTNEAFNWKGFSADNFYKSIDTMITRIIRENPGVEILLTTPGDSFKRGGKKGRVKNPTVVEVVNTIKKYAADKNLACFDWFAVSGGYGSMGKWYAAGMADRARIHPQGL
jgi:hypothetical protein